MLVDPKKMRDYFRAHTDYDPDDPDQERVMRNAFRWLLLGILVVVAGFVLLATLPLFVAISVLVLGLAIAAVGISRFIALGTFDWRP